MGRPVKKDGLLNFVPPPPGDWIARRACGPEHLELMFPGRGANTAIRKAKDVCARCPVREQCLNYAMDVGPKLTGVWGGTTQRGRAALRKARKSLKGNGGGDRGREPELDGPRAGGQGDGQRPGPGHPDLAGADGLHALGGVAA